MPAADAVRLRPGTGADLEAVNAVIQRAMEGWSIAPRVRRLVFPSYCYRAADLDHLHLLVAEQAGRIVGLAAWETADPRDLPDPAGGLLLHGLYVDPGQQGRGLGTRLLDAARQAARAHGGLLVKANRDARGFFRARGLQELPPGTDGGNAYPYRFWEPAAG